MRVRSDNRLESFSGTGSGVVGGAAYALALAELNSDGNLGLLNTNAVDGAVDVHLNTLGASRMLPPRWLCPRATRLRVLFGGGHVCDAAGDGQSTAGS